VLGPLFHEGEREHVVWQWAPKAKARA
jgi:hypothetical protein